MESCEATKSFTLAMQSLLPARHRRDTRSFATRMWGISGSLRTIMPSILTSSAFQSTARTTMTAYFRCGAATVEMETGAALVFDTSKIEVTDNSPLMVARVHYASTEARLQWLEDLVQRFAALLDATSVPDDQLHVPAYFLFERIKLFALFSKHDGFREEQEWRVVYAPDRDEGGKLSSMFHYSLGPRGAELRLRLKIAPLQGVSDAQMSLSRLLDRIILGPSISSLLASKAVIRMLDSVGKSNLSDRVVTSLIPFRPS